MQSFAYLHIVFLKIDMKASIKSSVTCLCDIIPVSSYWVAVFVVISIVEFPTTPSISFQGSTRANSKKTVLALLGEKQGIS